MNSITLPQQVLDGIELPSYELHTRPTADNTRKLSVFYGSRLIGSIYIHYVAGQSVYLGATLDHQSFGPYAHKMEAAEAVHDAFISQLTDHQRWTVVLANEIAENMTAVAS
jgi:hypothetical protein